MWRQRLREAGLTRGEVRDIASAVEHPQLRHRQMLARAFLVGDLPLIRFPLGRRPGSRHLPGLGEHTAEILSELGYGPQHQAGLARRGIIAMEPPQS